MNRSQALKPLVTLSLLLTLAHCKSAEHSSAKGLGDDIDLQPQPVADTGVPQADSTFWMDTIVPTQRDPHGGEAVTVQEPSANDPVRRILSIYPAVIVSAKTGSTVTFQMDGYQPLVVRVNNLDVSNIQVGAIVDARARHIYRANAQPGQAPFFTDLLAIGAATIVPIDYNLISSLQPGTNPGLGYRVLSHNQNGGRTDSDVEFTGATLLAKDLNGALGSLAVETSLAHIAMKLDFRGASSELQAKLAALQVGKRLDLRVMFTNIPNAQAPQVPTFNKITNVLAYP